MTAVGAIGIVAAVCTTGAFIPQILKIRRQGGEDLSYSMLSFYLTGVLLWLVYGLMFHAAAVIWANVAAAILVATSIVMKATHSGRVAKARSRRMRVAIDMDEVIADALSRHLHLYNAETSENLSARTIAEKGLREAIPERHRRVFERLPHEPGFFADLGVIDGSRRALETLVQDFDVFITSAAMEVPSSFDDKFRWMQKHFPFIPPSRIVFCGDKGIVDADYLIDDNSRHFKDFRGKGILFTAPHNAKEKAPIRANGWDDVLKILQQTSGLPRPQKSLARVRPRSTTLEVTSVFIPPIKNKNWTRCDVEDSV